LLTSMSVVSVSQTLHAAACEIWTTYRCSDIANSFIISDIEWSWRSFLVILNLSKSTAPVYCFYCGAFVMHRVRKKMHRYFASNFAKCWQIFKLLSLTHLAVNLQWTICQRSYHTSPRC